MLASNLQVGAVTMLSYANKIDDALITLFTSSIITVAYPVIVKIVNKDKNTKDEISDITSKYFILLLLLVVPLSIASVIFSEEIVRLIFLRGSFTSEYLVPTANAFAAYALGITFFTIRKYFNRIFYAYHNTKTPTINSIVTIIMNIVISIILSKFWGITGIALGTTISALISSISLVVTLSKKNRVFELKKVALPTLKIIAFSIVCIALARVVYLYVANYFNYLLGLIIAGTIGVALYLLIIVKFNLKQYLILLKK